jgi:hypothetical protein
MIHDVRGDAPRLWVPDYPAVMLGVGGSRRRRSADDVDQVLRYVTSAVDAAEVLGRRLVLVSGGCRVGADHSAELVAEVMGLDLLRFLPRDVPSGSPKFVAVVALFDRNTRVVEACERFVAQVSSDRTGGTEDAIKKAHKLGRPVDLLTVDGRVVTEQPPFRPARRTKRV